MSTPSDHRKPIRVLAYSSRNVPSLKTVNVVATSPRDPHHSVKEHLQLNGDQGRGVPTVMASPSVDSRLPTIYINGYSAPN